MFSATRAPWLRRNVACTDLLASSRKKLLMLRSVSFCSSASLMADSSFTVTAFVVVAQAWAGCVWRVCFPGEALRVVLKHEKKSRHDTFRGEMGIFWRNGSTFGGKGDFWSLGHRHPPET